MKNNLSGRSFYLSSLVVFCFFVGIFVGTVWINLMTKDIQEQLGVFGQAWILKSPKSFSLRLEQILPVLVKREMEAGFLWLTGMTLFAVPGLLAAAAFGGFTMAAVISLMTIQVGLIGLPLYMLSVIPQALFYVPVIAVLFFWGMERQKKMHVAGFLVLMLAVAAGALAEVCVNPYLMGVLSRFN